MKLKEIKPASHDITDSDVRDALKDLGDKYLKSNTTKFKKIQQYKYSISRRGEDKKINIYDVDKSGTPTRVVATVSFEKFRTGHKIKLSMADPDYRGKGIISAAYRLIIMDTRGPLYSDNSQTKAAQLLWVKLSQNPAFTVTGYDRSTVTEFEVKPNESGTQLVSANEDGTPEIYTTANGGNNVYLILRKTRKHLKLKEVMRMLGGGISDTSVNSLLDILYKNYGTQTDTKFKMYKWGEYSYQFIRVKDGNSRILIYSSTGDEVIANVSFVKFMDGFKIKYTAVRKEYRGNKFISTIYSLLVTRSRKPLYSDDTQTPDARAMWLALWKSNNFKHDIVAIDVDTGETYEVEPNQTNTELAVSKFQHGKEFDYYDLPLLYNSNRPFLYLMIRP